MGGERTEQTRPYWPYPVITAALSAATFGIAAGGTASKIVNNDASVLWYEAHEWGNFRWHVPAFLGQSYGSSLAGAAVAILHGFRTPYRLAVPAALALSTLGLWFMLGAAAYRRGRVAVATLACGAPALLSSYYAVYITTRTVERTIILTGVGVALLLSPRRHPVTIAAAVACAGIGVAIDVSSLLLVAPVIAWWLLDRRPTRREVASVVAGAAIALAYAACVGLFYLRRPQDALFPSPGAAPGMSNLRFTGAHLAGAFGLLVPELVRGWWMLVLAGAAVIVPLLATRHARFVVPACIVVAGTVYALATPIALAVPGMTFLPPSRVLLFLAPALVFLALLVAESYPSFAQRVRWPVTLALTLLTATSFVVRISIVDHKPAALLDTALQSTVYPFKPVEDVQTRCNALADEATAAHVDTVVVFNDPAIALACEALHGKRFRTLDLPFERRTWRLEALASETSRRALFVPGSGLCELARRRFETCEERDDVAVVQYAPQPFVNVLAILDLPVRAFGNGCDVDGIRCRSGHDARRRFPLPAPAAGNALAPGALADVVRRAQRGDTASIESGAERDAIMPRLRTALRGHTIEVGAPFRTGPRTFAAPLTLSSDGHKTELLGQFVATSDGAVVSGTTLCAIATQVGLDCAAGVPFGGTTWLPPNVG